MKKYRFMVNAFPIGETEFRSLLDNLRKGETIRLVADCKEGEHEDYDYFITFDYNTNKNRWDMVLTNNNGLRVIGENLIMKMLWRVECKPFESYELPMRMALHFGYLREQNSSVSYVIG